MWRKEEGGPLIEMVMIMPVLLVLLFTMVIVGIAINSKIAVSMAAREGARYYAVHCAESDVDSNTRAIVTDRLKGSITASEGEFAKSFNPSTDIQITVSTDSNYVTVKVTYHQSTFIADLLSLIGGKSWGDSFALTSAATFKNER